MLALFAALAFVGWDAVQKFRHYAKASATYGVAVHAPAADAASVTGWAEGRRTIVYPSRWVDAQHWIMQTQQMLATGEARVRHVDDDNAPHGRAVHWGAPFRWWLAACAAVDRAFTGEPIGRAVERSAIFANPALLSLLLSSLVPWVAGRFGGGAAASLALLMVGTAPLYVLFDPENMDHHGAIQACAMVTLIAVLAGGSGWTRGKGDAAGAERSWLPDAAQARRAFTLSGVAGGVGLWVSAAGMIPVFAGIGLGALVSARLGRNASAAADFDADLWRRWGAIGGVTALGCYLLEYFPGHFGWRLEVNHPLYAFAWLGAGEVLAQLTAILAGRRRSAGNLAHAAGDPSRCSRSEPRATGGGGARWRLVLGAAAMVAPAVVIALAGERVFAVSDRFLWSLSNDYTPEFQGLGVAMGRAGWSFTTIASCLPMLLVVPVVGWLSRRSTPALARALVAVPLAATILFWLMALKEIRWWTVGYGFMIGVVVMVGKLIPGLARSRRQRAACWAVVAVAFAPGLIDTVRRMPRAEGLTGDDLFSFAERDLAHTLRQRVGSGPLTILSGPATTSRMIYFGGAKGLGTPYWENLEGLKRAAAIFAAETADEARERVRAAGITHVVWLSWDDFADAYVRLARGLGPEEPITRPAFGFELGRARVPPAWLRRLPDHLPDVRLFEAEHALIFEVTERTRPEHVVVRAARDFLYRGQLAAAVELLPELERYRGDLASQVALARLHIATQNRAGLDATVERVRELRGQLATLEPEDRVDLLAVLAISGKTGEAREELAGVLRAFDAAALRQLTPGALRNLLGLVRQLGGTWPDPQLPILAAQLLPPDGRL